MTLTSLDDAAWGSPWREHAVGDKVLLCLALVLTALLTPPWPGALCVTLISVGLIVGSARIPPAMLVPGLSIPLAFLLLGSGSLLVTLGPTPADAWASAGPLAVGPRSAREAGEVLAHGFAGAAAVMVLAMTTPLVDVLTWLRRLHVPDPLLEIASLISRLLLIFLTSALAIRQAQVARLGDRPLGPRSRRRAVRIAGIGMASVALRAWERAQRLAEGLAGRGFDNSLATLAPGQQASWRFRIVSIVSVTLVWLVTLVHSRGWL